MLNADAREPYRKQTFVLTMFIVMMAILAGCIDSRAAEFVPSSADLRLLVQLSADGLKSETAQFVMEYESKVKPAAGDPFPVAMTNSDGAVDFAQRVLRIEYDLDIGESSGRNEMLVIGSQAWERGVGPGQFADWVDLGENAWLSGVYPWLLPEILPYATDLAAGEDGWYVGTINLVSAASGFGGMPMGVLGSRSNLTAVPFTIAIDAEQGVTGFKMTVTDPADASQYVKVGYTFTDFGTPVEDVEPPSDDDVYTPPEPETSSPSLEPSVVCTLKPDGTIDCPGDSPVDGQSFTPVPVPTPTP